MGRSAIHQSKQEGWSNVATVETVGCHLDTVGLILREPVDQEGKQRQRVRQIDVYDLVSSKTG